MANERKLTTNANAQKCQGCQRFLVKDMYLTGNKRCDDCCTKRLKPRRFCSYDNCTIRPIYGKEGSNIKEYCKKHCPIGYVDVVHKKCKYTGCTTRPTFGKVGSRTGDGEYCSKHAPVGYINLVKQLCKHDGCVTQPSYGKKGSNIKEYCKLHCPNGYVNVISKNCKHSNCDTQPNYGKKGSMVKEYCKKHAPDNYVSISKKCEYEGCQITPRFGKNNSNLAVFCKKHAPTDYVDVISKRCNYRGCNTQPHYGKKGTKFKEFCKKHAPTDYVDVKSKLCIYEGCTSRPSYGKKGTNKKEYCKKHCPDDYVDVVHKKCVFNQCNKIPTYGQGNSREYCKEHAPVGYIDVGHPICKESNCKIRASYSTPSLKITKNCTNNVLNELTELNKPTHCHTHKKDGMILVRKCTKKNCNKGALYGTKNPIHCDDHKNNNDICLITRKCKQCCYIGTVDLNGLCWDNCVATTIYNKEYKKRTTSKQNKIVSLLQKEVNINFMCVDKVIDPDCSLRRPDIVYDLGKHILIVEVDENAGHDASYHKKDCEIERIRMFEISNSFEGRPIIFIRYNPDSYSINGILKKTPASKREPILIKWVNKAIDHTFIVSRSKDYFPIVLVVYLFYNEYDESVATFSELSQEGLKNGLIPCKK